MTISGTAVHKNRKPNLYVYFTLVISLISFIKGGLQALPFIDYQHLVIIHRFQGYSCFLCCTLGIHIHMNSMNDYFWTQPFYRPYTAVLPTLHSRSTDLAQPFYWPCTAVLLTLHSRSTDLALSFYRTCTAVLLTLHSRSTDLAQPFN